MSEVIVDRVDIGANEIHFYVPHFSTSSPDLCGKKFVGSYRAFVGRYGTLLLCGNILNGGFYIDENARIHPGFYLHNVLTYETRGEKILQENMVIGPKGGVLKGAKKLLYQIHWKLVIPPYGKKEKPE